MITNAISVDVEEYFHPSEVERAVTGNWEHYPARVVPATRRILDLFDTAGVRATFFVLGWVAQKYPALVREIDARGHELGCHSFAHRLVYRMTPAEFLADTQRAVAAIEDASGISPRVYRAPSYSITAESMWALEALVECGFTHDSSIYPIAHDRYGIPGFARHAAFIQTPSGPIYEVPIATAQLPGGRIAPVGGGAYLRLLPLAYTAAGIRRVNAREGQPACLYFHPWEIDEAQPRLARGIISRVRTYHGLSSMFGKLESLLAHFRFSTVLSVFPTPTRQFLDCRKPREKVSSFSESIPEF